MSGVAQRRSVLRDAGKVALVPAAALGVHQLRYYLAFGSAAGAELARQGHSYLHSVVPWVVLLAGLALGGFLLMLGRAAAGQVSAPRFSLSLGALWLITTAVLVAIYMTQEWLEGLLATGHPAGLVGIFGYGGWWAGPVAACFGLVLAVVFHGARWVLAQVAERCGRRPRQVRGAALPSPRPRAILRPRLSPLAGGWSGRGPPHQWETH